MTGYRLPRAIVYTPPRNREQRLTDIATITNNLLVNRMLGTVVGPGKTFQLHVPSYRDLIGLLPEKCPDCTNSWAASVNSSHITNCHTILEAMRAAPVDESSGPLALRVDCPKCGITYPPPTEYIGKLADA